MDRLSTYATRETEPESEDDKKDNEEEATRKLLERLKIASEAKAKAPAEQENGTATNGDDSTKEAETEAPPKAAEEAPETNGHPPAKGIPGTIKLFETGIRQ